MPGNRQGQASALPMLPGLPSLQAAAHAKESWVNGMWGGERRTNLTPLLLRAAAFGKRGVGWGAQDS